MKWLGGGRCAGFFWWVVSRRTSGIKIKQKQNGYEVKRLGTNRRRSVSTMRCVEEMSRRGGLVGARLGARRGALGEPEGAGKKRRHGVQPSCWLVDWLI